MSNQRLEEILKNAGISKTVYAFVTPETREGFDSLLGEGNSPLREALHDSYEEAWTQKQDIYHEAFFNTWQEWAAPIVTIDPAQFPYRYPTAGASEPIREAIAAYGNKARVKNFTPRIHIFAGEYEGYKSYADSYGIECVVHDRNTWRETLDQINENDQFYLSQPSAIDGNVWDEFDSFASSLNEKQSKADLMLDITYVGCVTKEFHIKTDYPNISQIFLSLSKPLGMYYHRCGGTYAREEKPGLFGNKWFKNTLSMNIATELMKKHDVYELPRKYAPFQQQAIDQASKKLGFALTASDIYLEATSSVGENKSDLENYLLRAKTDHSPGLARYCLTPTIDALVKHKDSVTVKPRAHETLTPNNS